MGQTALQAAYDRGAGMTAAPKEPTPLVSAIQGLDALNERLTGIAMRLTKLGDAAGGPRPEGGDASTGEKVATVGALNVLLTRIAGAQRALDYIDSQVGRLDGLIGT